jgi:hypothetical protein
MVMRYTRRGDYQRMKYARLPALNLDDEREHLRRIVDRLIEHLYKPAERGWIVSDWAAAEFGDEAVNWGDLGCVEVEMLADGRFGVTVAEADPGAARLRHYLTRWLHAWQWPAVVTLEW